MNFVVTCEVIILLVIMVLVIGIDLYLNFAEPESDTFSALSRAWARWNPFWPWSWVCLPGGSSIGDWTSP